MKFKLSCLMLSVVTGAFADMVTIPSRKVLEPKVKARTYVDFDKRTGIIEALAGQRVEATNIVVIINEAFERYGNCEDPGIIQKRKTRLLEIFLENSSAALSQLENERFYKPSKFDGKVIIPPMEVLQRRFNAIAEQHFNERTEIIAALAGKEVAVDEVVTRLEADIKKYEEYMKEDCITRMINNNKWLFLQAFLKDTPAALELLKARGVYKPLPKSIWKDVFNEL